ncbi:SecDF P1 head subdomain-containing protein [Parerythrobacter jejuensis]|uniref:SecDF P1 head subdomain domain-containing protein n=1 Tax=Parerythrobacter jejuensis TaxID=795812 RepID=A0A845AQU6_9SPHN|nr:hypothetical protein [Parerythrobacter jejuensis]MXP31839.1 hypothetical protein [Parerythrobacter jejuensis]
MRAHATIVATLAVALMGCTAQAAPDPGPVPTASIPDTPVASLATGLWVGDLPLCSETVLDAKVTTGSSMGMAGPNFFLNIRLAEEAANIFAGMTRARVGQELPIMLDGKVLLSPRINEQILGGALQISAPREELERALQRIEGPCG